MRKESLEFLRKLMDVPSPSGFEQPAQRVFREYTAEFADEVETDVHGNTTAILNRDGKLRVMLAGHCDELGLMVNHIEDAGFIRFAAIGGIDQALLPGSRVVVHSKRGPVRGVIGKKPIHLLKPEERKKVLEIKRLWIDIGARNKADAGKVVEVGDPITMAGGFELLRNQLAVSRGFDDKIGSFVVAETVRLLSGGKLKAAVFGVSTVQEELGLRGAQTSAFGIDPHVGIAIDVGFASDFPGVDKSEVGEVNLGKGPVLHRGANINPVLGEHLVKTAKSRKIPYQMQSAPKATGTDANAMQVTRAGVAAALVSIPNRYMHTSVEMVSLRDAENAARLLAAAIEKMSEKMDFTP